VKTAQEPTILQMHDPLERKWAYPKKGLKMSR